MRRRLAIIALTILASLSVVALVVLCLHQTVLHRYIESRIQLIPGTTFFRQWQTPTIPIILQFYFFNLSNPVEFLAGNKPFLKQLGPYTYRERRFKKNIQFSKTDSTVSYEEVKQYFFLPEASHGSESDLVTNVNLVYLTVAVQIEKYWKPLIHIVEMAEQIFGEQLLMSRNVSQWLWGYEDPLLLFLQSHKIPVNVTQIGLFAGKNNTDSGPFVVDSGLLNRGNLGSILAYRGSRSLSCWATPDANQINGSDGSLFHPFIRPGESVYVFSPDLCRSIEFSPREQVLVNGLWCMKYLPLEDTLDSPVENPKNRGFCPRWPACYEGGALDLSTCQPGPPIAMSMPHFVHANRVYQDAVDGLHPSSEFNTTLFLEPKTGVVVSASRKLQLNANVTRNPEFHQLSKVHTVLLPIMFVNESANLDSDTAQLLRLSIVALPFSLRLVSIVLLCICLPILLVIVGLQLRTFFHLRMIRESEQPLLSEQPICET